MNTADVTLSRNLEAVSVDGPFQRLTLVSSDPSRCIRPGDKVHVAGDYGVPHASPRNVLLHVDSDDVMQSRGSSPELFYMPKAWRPDAPAIDKSREPRPSPKAILEFGELHRIHEHSGAIRAITDFIETYTFDPENCGYHHGPDHWERVSANAISVSRALGIDPLVPYVFGLVHDSHRINEHEDPGHGARAAHFVRARRDTLFHFLSDEEVGDLVLACKFHSDGRTRGPLRVQACWDADRLDLWRVSVRPDPRFLCTAYARRAEVIEASDHVLRDVDRIISQASLRPTQG